ncbi:MAG: M42 family metallopeptidase [Syntrophothermus sp.]
MKDLIKRLAETQGPSGSEEPVRAVIMQELEGLVDEVKVDALGNVIAVKHAKGPRVMLSAHMDEIGVVVTHIDEKGFLRFAPVGSLDPHRLPGARVAFANGAIGVIGLEKLKELKDLKFARLFIDIGATDRAGAEAKVKIGDTAAMWRPMEDLGDRLAGKALDDRIGCAVLLEVLRRLKKPANDTYFVFSVQEELGKRGAETSAFGINPDYGIAVDVTITGDTPEAPPVALALGKGPAIKVMDSSLISHPGVRQLLITAAQEAKVPYQLEVLDFGGNDAGAIHLTRAGVPSGTVSIPARYVHSPSEMADLGDVEGAVRLLLHCLEKPLSL